MFIRLPLAFILGLMLYVVAAVMAGGYDGIITVIFMPIMGGIMTGLALAVLTVLGVPLLFPKIWAPWRRLWWASVVLFLAGIVAVCFSWHPDLRIIVEQPELHTPIPSFEPMLGIGGWGLIMFSVAYCPLLGFRGDKRWV